MVSQGCDEGDRRGRFLHCHTLLSPRAARALHAARPLHGPELPEKSPTDGPSICSLHRLRNALLATKVRDRRSAETVARRRANPRTSRNECFAIRVRVAFARSRAGPASAGLHFISFRKDAASPKLRNTPWAFPPDSKGIAWIQCFGRGPHTSLIVPPSPTVLRDPAERNQPAAARCSPSIARGQPFETGHADATPFHVPGRRHAPREPGNTPLCDDPSC